MKGASTLVLVLAVLSWTGSHCEVDVDECAAGLVSCGPGECVNLDGSYKCVCAAGFCGLECAVRDPCFDPAPVSEDPGSGEEAGPGQGAASGTLGPCQHGGTCEQRCTTDSAYICHCIDGWGGQNCTQQAVSAQAGGGASTSSVLIGVGAALVALACGGAALAALAAQARRKRATRGTYSPSGQEYCNPRANLNPALKPPPEERLI
ncbi:hypothetical protein evm_006880 [Chilo suppressalis]|nr:hypothetical protein evm_006880 [Chilo suppressalis]